MEHADKAPDGPQHRESAAKRAPGPLAAPALVDNSPHGVSLGALTQMMNHSPLVEAQHALNARISGSPYVVAQRKQLESLFGDTAQRSAAPEEELLQGKFAPVQRAEPEEEELLQGKFEAVQRAEPDRARRANDTGLPDGLKTGVEALSGVSLDNVKVHYNSAQPAQLNALAYAQGNDIHLAPGQERHLPHEAWHVVQQAQGRVQPTMQLKDGVPVNDDAGLEHEADVMGARALAPAARLAGEPQEEELLQSKLAPAQRKLADAIDHSSGPIAQQALSERIADAGPVTAQRRQLHAPLGDAAVRPLDSGQALQRYVAREGGVNISNNRLFAVRGDGKASELFVANHVVLPEFQHVKLKRSADELDTDGDKLVKVSAEYEQEDELAAMYCGKFSEMVTGVKESQENETALPGRSLYANDLFTIEKDYKGAWKNHFAPVVVADGSDRGTLETAVFIDHIWWGIYGKERGQSFRYKTAVADVKLQLSLVQVSPKVAEGILQVLEKYAEQGVPTEEHVSEDMLAEITAIETALKKIAELVHQEPHPTELPSVEKERQEREAEDRSRVQSQIVLAIRDNEGDWQQQLQNAHKFSMKSKIDLALQETDLDENQRGRLLQARDMVQEQVSISSDGTSRASGPSFLTLIGGLAILSVLGGLLAYAKYRK